MNAPTDPVGLRRRPGIAGMTTVLKNVCRRLLVLGTAALLALPGAAPLAAQDNGTGVISGRVQNEVTGDYIGKARVSLKGSNRSTLTDDGGYYSLPNVPAGQATVEVSYTGLEAQAASLTVTAGLAATAPDEFLR